MMIRPYSGPNTRVRWPKAKAVLLLVVAAWGAQAQEAALARLKSGIEAMDKGDQVDAMRHFAAAQAQLPALADYIAFWSAQSQAQSKRHDAVAPALEPVFRNKPTSPLAGRAAVLGANSLLEIGDFRGAAQMLTRVRWEEMPPMRAEFLMARALEGSGDVVAAAARYQSVYYGFPLSDESKDAREAIRRLESALGDKYPPVLPQAKLDRAQKLLDGRQAAQARAEYEEMLPSLGGLEREQALVRISAADYQARKTEAAMARLRGLELKYPEADAERLYYIAACARRLDRYGEMQTAVDELTSRSPSSPWRLKALVMAANIYLVDNDASRFAPLYKACADAFPDAEDAPYCHWKVAWRAYIERQPSAELLLREHLTRYPASEKAGASVYYLGRLAEQRRDYPAARRYYEELQSRFPNYYYAHMTRERLKRTEVQQAGASRGTEEFLNGIRWPDRNRKPDFVPDASTTQRIQRARLLTSARLETWAEIELRYGARNGENRYLLAMELAETANRRGAPDVGLRYIKSVVPDYLWIPRDAAPARFWKLAFPFPYRASIERNARANDLDSFLVAALIRQESEFDPKAVSVSNAIGLMQVLPGTGRELGRRVGIHGVRVATLKNPEVNLKLGTYYMRRQLDARNGSVEETLAGYNAGPSRIPKWKSWADFQEPPEFVESIPFTQTRDYVQIIMRNADFYRWLYSNEPVPAETAAVQAPAEPAKKPASTASKPKKAAKTPAKGKASASRKK